MTVRAHTKLLIVLMLLAAPTASHAQRRTPPDQMDMRSVLPSDPSSDITFRVPVELRDVRTNVRVNCYVRDDDDVMLGSGTEVVQLDAQGNYTGTMIIGIRAAQRRSLADASTYQCSLFGKRSSGGWTIIPGGEDELQPRPGTEFNSTTFGEL